MATLEQGRIVWVELADPNGQNVKKRPWVIITPTAEIHPDRNATLAAISSASVAPLAERVELRWNREGTTCTGLKRESYVVCSWLRVVACSELVPEGSVHPSEMVAILAMIEKLRLQGNES